MQQDIAQPPAKPNRPSLGLFLRMVLPAVMAFSVLTCAALSQAHQPAPVPTQAKPATPG